MKKDLFILCLFVYLPFVAIQAQSQDADAAYLARDYERAAMLYAKAWQPGGSAQNADRLVDAYSQLGDYQAIYNLLKDEIPGRYSAKVVLAGGHAARSVGQYDLAEKWYKAYYRHDADGARHWVDVLDYARSQKEQPALYSVNSAAFNTANSDYAATVRGNTIYWTSHRQDIIRTDKRNVRKMDQGSAQLYKSVKSGGSFGPERFLQADIKNFYGNAHIQYDMDGRIAAYVKNMNKKDGVSAVDPMDRTQGIYIALTDAVNGDWSIDDAFPFNSTEYSCAYPFIMNNGRTMYFASNRPDSYGGFDIYVSHKVGGEWSIPKNLGPEINTPYNEISPIINNGQLYFASEGHPGLGGFDIFRAEMVNGVYDRIFNLGKDVNSGYDDYDLFLDPRGSLGLFTSNRPGGKGAEDIYHCKKIGGQIKVVVRDAQTKEPLANSEVQVDGRAKSFTTGYYGDVAINISDKSQANVRVRKNGYVGKMIPVNIDVNSHIIKNYDIFLDRDANGSVAINTDNQITDAAMQAEKQRAMEMERKRQEAERQRALEAQRLQSEADAEKKRMMEADRQRQLEAERQRAAEAERARQEQERLRMEAEKKRQAELERQRAAEVERQRAAEAERRRQEEERLRMEAEKQRQAELERQRRAEEERRRTAEAERLKQEELARIRTREAERKRLEMEEKMRREEEARRRAAQTQTTNPVTTTTTTSTGNIYNSVYAVQLAALSEQGSDIDLTPYKQLYDLGTIYKLNKGIGVKIRLGTYGTEGEARAILDKVRKRGYPDAYLVIQDDQMAIQAPPTESQNRPNNVTTSTTTRTTKITDPSGNTRVFGDVTEGYKIRMAALSDLSNFSDSAVRDLGHIEIQRKPSASVIYIAGFQDFQSAKNALPIVQRKGYRDAYIVLYKDGVYNTIR